MPATLRTPDASSYGTEVRGFPTRFDHLDRLADICASYLGKGMTVALEGRIQTRQWDDDRGMHHWKTEIVANAVEMLSGRRKKDYAADALAVQANALGVQPAGEADDDEDDEAEPSVAPGDPEPEAAVLVA
jgi:single-stranded DNA-binding protein